MERTVSAFFAGLFGVAAITAVARPEIARNIDALGGAISRSISAALGR